MKLPGRAQESTLWQHQETELLRDQAVKAGVSNGRPLQTHGDLWRFGFLLSKVLKGRYGFEEQRTFTEDSGGGATLPRKMAAARLEASSEPQPLKSCGDAAGRGPGLLPRPV